MCVCTGRRLSRPQGTDERARQGHYNAVRKQNKNKNVSLFPLTCFFLGSMAVEMLMGKNLVTTSK